MLCAKSLSVLRLNALNYRNALNQYEVVKIQTSDGNWNYDPYMHGMANGLLVAQAIMHDLHDFTGLSAPDKWLDSRENAQTAPAEAGKQAGE